MSTPPLYKRKYPAAVYRLIGNDGALLYIGCSTSPLNRVMEHTKRRDWGRNVARVDLRWFDTWYEARTHEIETIRAENPVWNVYEKTVQANASKGKAA